VRVDCHNQLLTQNAGHKFNSAPSGKSFEFFKAHPPGSFQRP
jgi:hypothetical protein